MTQLICNTYPERAVAVGSHEVRVHHENSQEGNVTYINAIEKLHDYPNYLFDKLYEYADKYPNRLLIAQRELNTVTGKRGDWIRLTYSEVLQKARNIAQALLKYDLSPERPLMILSDNSLEVFLLMYGAMLANAPYTLIAPAYSLIAKTLISCNTSLIKSHQGYFTQVMAKAFCVSLKRVVN